MDKKKTTYHTDTLSQLNKSPLFTTRIPYKSNGVLIFILDRLVATVRSP